MEAVRSPRKQTLLLNIAEHPYLYLMVVPALVFFVTISFIPAAGSVIAWQQYSIFKGILGSPWVGWKNFRDLFNYYDFYRVFRNTLAIGAYRIIFGFPVPIILALFLNEIGHSGFKRVAQSCLYLPYFLSWVIVGQIFINILHPSSGIVNILLDKVLGAEPVFFLGKERLFQPIVTATYIWKFSGYQSIVYLAAISTIDEQLYEAATIDGANRWVQAWRVTIPSLTPIIVIMLLLAIGQFLEIGFNQIYVLLNPLVIATGDIFDTYVYRVGLVKGRYSFATAIGLFKSVIGFTLLTGGNLLAKKITGKGLFRR